MSIGIVENVVGSFGFAKDRLVGKWLDWLILIILCIIPIIGWFLLLGFLVRVYRGGEAKLGEWLKMLIDGILFAIIAFIYMLIPLLVIFLLGGTAIIAAVASAGAITNPSSLLPIVAGLGIAGIIALIIAIIFGILMTMALVRFAKEERFGAAFEFGKLFAVIGKIGWIHYILSWIVLMIIFTVIFFVIGLIMGFIPFLGMLIMWIIAPLLFIWEARFYAYLYESA